MEVSSQALMLHRTQGFLFDLGIFTNLSPDHIGPNEHKDFDDYLQSRICRPIISVPTSTKISMTTCSARAFSSASAG